MLLLKFRLAASPTRRITSLKGCQCHAGRRKPSPQEKTLRWSGLALKPSSSQKCLSVRALTGDSIADPTLQKLKFQPCCPSALLPVTFLHPKPVLPISYFQLKTRLQYLHPQTPPTRSPRSRPRNPERNFKAKFRFLRTAQNLKALVVHTWTTPQSSGRKIDWINTSFIQHKTMSSKQSSHRLLSPTSQLTYRSVTFLLPGQQLLSNPMDPLDQQGTTRSPLCKSQSLSVKWASFQQSREVHPFPATEPITEVALSSMETKATAGRKRYDFIPCKHQSWYCLQYRNVFLYGYRCRCSEVLQKLWGSFSVVWVFRRTPMDLVSTVGMIWTTSGEML